jgi:hypothetical protein
LVALTTINTHFPLLLLHALPDPWHAPRLPKFRKPCNLERIVSLKEFCEEKPMSLLGFEVTPSYLTFLAFFDFIIYVLMSFPKVY